MSDVAGAILIVLAVGVGIAAVFAFIKNWPEWLKITLVVVAILLFLFALVAFFV